MGIHNKAASCFHGRKSDWCTAIPGLDYFNDYYQEVDPLFVFETPGKEWFQFHYGSEQFADLGDRQVSNKTFEALHGELKKTEAYEKYHILKRYDLNRMARIGSDASLDEIKAAIASVPKEKRDHWLGNLARYQPGARSSKKVRPEVLRLLATEEFEDVSGIARNLALNPDTPVDVLEYIAKNNKYGGNQKLARKELETRKDWEERYPGRGERTRAMLRPDESERFAMRENFARFLK